MTATRIQQHRNAVTLVLRRGGCGDGQQGTSRNGGRYRA